MKSIFALGSTLALALLAACAQQHQPRPALPFVEAEHAVYGKPGSAKITGQAFLTQKGGGIVTCAGREVILMPATNYFMNNLPSEGQRIEFLFYFSQMMHQMPHQEYMRSATCDAQGNFQFEKLPAARWIVISNVTWQAGRSMTGGVVRSIVETKSGQTAKVLLSSGDVMYGL